MTDTFINPQSPAAPRGFSPEGPKSLCRYILCGEIRPANIVWARNCRGRAPITVLAGNFDPGSRQISPGSKLLLEVDAEKEVDAHYFACNVCAGDYDLTKATGLESDLRSFPESFSLPTWTQATSDPDDKTAIGADGAAGEAAASPGAPAAAIGDSSSAVSCFPHAVVPSQEIVGCCNESQTETHPAADEPRMELCSRELILAEGSNTQPVTGRESTDPVISVASPEVTKQTRVLDPALGPALTSDPAHLSTIQASADDDGEEINGLADVLDVSVLPVALDYYQRGFCIVPQLPGEKHPAIKWKPFQESRPELQQVEDWYAQWPNAGIAVILGPVSNLFAIDVDGPEAHEALLTKLGSEPVAPKVLSGSGKPHRYHLFFRHPAEIPTNAKFTPWHPKLEFRGHRGIIILPPSLHKSGNRYTWAPGQSLEDLALPEVPQPILEALVERAARDPGPKEGQTTADNPREDLSQVQHRALAYLRQMPPAIEGQGGDKQSFTAACHLVLDFALGSEEALPVMRQWNDTHCQPPWVEEELRRKLQEADKLRGQRGNLLRAVPKNRHPKISQVVSQAPAKPVPSGVPFPVSVPDYVLVDWSFVQPRAKKNTGRPSVASGIWWLFHWEIIRQQSSALVLPDSVLGQCVWGADKNQWPPNWHGPLYRIFYPGRKEICTQRQCELGCLLHGREGQPHCHFAISFQNPQKTTRPRSTVRASGPTSLGMKQAFQSGIARKSQPGKLPALVRMKKVSIARACVGGRCGERTATQHHLAHHELSVIFSHRARCRSVARIWTVCAGCPLPDMPGRLENCRIMRGGLPLGLGRQAGARPTREGIRFVPADVADWPVGIECRKAAQRHLPPLAVTLLPVQRRGPALGLHLGPAVRHPQRRGAIPAVAHEVEPLGVANGP